MDSHITLKQMTFRNEIRNRNIENLFKERRNENYKAPNHPQVLWNKFISNREKVVPEVCCKHLDTITMLPLEVIDFLNSVSLQSTTNLITAEYIMRMYGTQIAEKVDVSRLLHSSVYDANSLNPQVLRLLQLNKSSVEEVLIDFWRQCFKKGRKIDKKAAEIVVLKFFNIWEDQTISIPLFHFSALVKELLKYKTYLKDLKNVISVLIQNDNHVQTYQLVNSFIQLYSQEKFEVLWVVSLPFFQDFLLNGINNDSLGCAAVLFDKIMNFNNEIQAFMKKYIDFLSHIVIFYPAAGRFNQRHIINILYNSVLLGSDYLELFLSNINYEYILSKTDRFNILNIIQLFVLILQVFTSNDTLIEKILVEAEIISTLRDQCFELSNITENIVKIVSDLMTVIKIITENSPYEYKIKEEFEHLGCRFMEVNMPSVAKELADICDFSREKN